MKLIEAHIKHFRSIQDQKIKFHDITALVGMNNSGKSSILRALNSFFNYDIEKRDFEEGNHQYSNQSYVRIELVFINCPNKKEFTSKLDNGKLKIRMTYSHKTKKRSLNYRKQGKYNKLEKQEQFIKKLKKEVNFVLIPTIRDYRQVVWSESALLKTVLREYFKIHTSKRDTLTPKVKSATDNLERNALSKVENELERLYSINKTFNFKVRFDKTIDYSLLLDDITLDIDENGQIYNITESGSGIHSLTIIALYRYLAELKHNNIILGIEEPEINLHPQAQRELIKSIERYNSISNETQIIFTTHSAVIIDQLEHNDIILFRKVRDSKRGFKTAISQIPNNFWEKHNLHEFKYYQFYKYRNSEFFFSKFIIIVESKNDAEVVKFLLDKEGIDINIAGISIISLEGVGNIIYPFYLLKYLNIPYFIILDKDFFIHYINGSLEMSRDNQGLPKYRYEFKKENLKIIKELITKEEDRNKLLRLMKSNHSKTLDLLERYNIILMNYNLEMDLICSKKAVEIYCNKFDMKINFWKENQKVLLVKHHKRIKRIENIMYVLKKMSNRNLPNSYKRIRKLGRNLKGKLLR